MSIGQEVTHDFSGGLGVIKDIDFSKKRRGYNYFVRWQDGQEDWFKQEFLIVLAPTPHKGEK